MGDVDREIEWLSILGKMTDRLRGIEGFAIANVTMISLILMLLFLGFTILYIRVSGIQQRIGYYSRTMHRPSMPSRYDSEESLYGDTDRPRLASHAAVDRVETVMQAMAMDMSELKKELMTTVQSIETRIDHMPPVAGEKFVQSMERWGGGRSEYIGLEATWTPSNEEEGKKEEEEGKGAEKKKRV